MLQRKQEKVMARYGAGGGRSKPARLSENYLEEEQVRERFGYRVEMKAGWKPGF